MNIKLGIQTEWLPTALNVLADDISRLHLNEDSEYNYSSLIVDHPCLLTCRKFQPSNILLSIVYDILLSNTSPDPLILKRLRPQDLGSHTS